MTLGVDSFRSAWTNQNQLINHHRTRFSRCACYTERRVNTENHPLPGKNILILLTYIKSYSPETGFQPVFLSRTSSDGEGAGTSSSAGANLLRGRLRGSPPFAVAMIRFPLPSLQPAESQIHGQTDGHQRGDRELYKCEQTAMRRLQANRSSSSEEASYEKG